MEDLGHQIKRIDRLFKLRMDRNLEKSGLTNSQMHVLMYLLHHPDQKVTQKCLCQEFEVKHSTMSGILNRMKDKNLIDIKIDEDNKKFKNIYVSVIDFIVIIDIQCFIGIIHWARILQEL